MYWYLILFLIVMFLLSQKEGFSSGNTIQRSPVPMICSGDQKRAGLGCSNRLNNSQAIGTCPYKSSLSGSICFSDCPAGYKSSGIVCIPSNDSSPEGTHDVYGPGDGGMDTSSGNGGSGGNGNITGSNLYDPNFPNVNNPKKPGQTPSSSGPNSFGAAQPPPDNGSNSSDTTTQQNAIYFYKPFAMLPFPSADGPPQPFLNDFKVFQK